MLTPGIHKKSNFAARVCLRFGSHGSSATWCPEALCLLDNTALALRFLLDDNVLYLWRVAGLANRSTLNFNCSWCRWLLYRTRSISVSPYFVFTVLLWGCQRCRLWHRSGDVCCAGRRRNRRGCTVMICLVVTVILTHRRQFGSHTAWGWGDWFATLYHFNYLVGFSTEITIRSKRVIPATVSAENMTE